MTKHRHTPKSPETAAGVRSPASATILAGSQPIQLPGLPEGPERGIHVKGDTPQARWGEIDRAMAGDAAWRQGTQVFALILHTAAEQNEPQEMQGFADAFTGMFFSWVTDEAARLGLTLTEEQADDIGSAFFSAALDVMHTLPFSETGAAS